MTNRRKFRIEDCDGPCVLTNPEWGNEDHEAYLISPQYNKDGSYRLSSTSSGNWNHAGGVIWKRKNIKGEPKVDGLCLICPRHTRALSTTLNLLRMLRVVRHEL